MRHSAHVRQTVRLTINSEPYEVDVLPNRMLIDTLRDDIGLTGTKEGCGIGVCGACTVLLNGDMISSCLCLTVMADGCDIVTIEGLVKGDELDSIQNAFIERGGFQCGICTPGQIVAARALLNAIPSPSEEEIEQWMMGNLCRCTGYYKIVESIKAAAEAERRSKAASQAG